MCENNDKKPIHEDSNSTESDEGMSDRKFSFINMLLSLNQSISIIEDQVTKDSKD